VSNGKFPSLLLAHVLQPAMPQPVGVSGIRKDHRTVDYLVQEQFEKEAIANTQNSHTPCIQKSLYADQQKYDVGLVAVKRGPTPLLRCSWRASSFCSKSCLALAKGNVN